MPECPLRALTGVPCPFCGMTRGVFALMHGDVLGSLALNPGIVLAVLGAVLVAVLLVWGRPRVVLPMWLPWAVLAGLWSFQLVKYATGRPL